ncbi:MAG: carbohydrate kinase [Devosia sp.]
MLDLGKTNSKMFVFSAEGEIIWERRRKPSWRDANGRRVLDDASLFDWICASLAEAAAGPGVAGVIVSGHGCTFALVDENGLVLPILDYEQDLPPAIAIDYAQVVPDFTETYSPDLPLGQTYGRHLYWMFREEPQAFARAKAILGYPQYWGWRFGGQMVGEYSYLGVHSQLWQPLRRDYSSLVDRFGWRPKMPEIVPAGSAIGAFKGLDSAHPVTIHNGIHDSNAALALYHLGGVQDFTLVSTGTWVVMLDASRPLSQLDPARDMLANVDIAGRPVTTIRFMGGKEYDLISRNWEGPVSAGAVQKAVDAGMFATPSWAAAGPFPDSRGRIVGGDPDGEVRAAVATLYTAMMTDLSLDLLGSTSTIILDGGLARSDLYCALLAQLRPSQRVCRSTIVEGSAAGAAAVAYATKGLKPFTNLTSSVTAASVAGLEAYRRDWRRLADEYPPQLKVAP